MAFEKYNFIEEKLKKALVANRNEPVSNHSEKAELIAYGVKLIEEQLMNKTLSFDEIDALQTDLGLLKEGKISEELIATYRERKKRDEARSEWHETERREHPRGEHHITQRVSKKTNRVDVVKPEPAKLVAAEESFTFEDMYLKVGDRLQLEPPAVISHERFIVSVIGYVKDASIIVTSPVAANGLQLHLQEKDKVTIRSFSGQNVYAFTSTILRINNINFSYLHLSYPESIEGFKIRKVTRIRSNIIATATNEKIDANAHLSAIITDISEDGASLTSKQPLGAIGDIVHLAFRIHVHNIEIVLFVNGIIRKATHEGKPEESSDRAYGHGVEFQDLQANDQVVLQSMIYQQMIENPRGVM